MNTANDNKARWLDDDHRYVGGYILKFNEQIGSLPLVISPKTNLRLNWYERVPVFYHKRLDPVVGENVIGHATLMRHGIGVYAIIAFDTPTPPDFRAAIHKLIDDERLLLHPEINASMTLRGEGDEIVSTLIHSVYVTMILHAREVAQANE